jgi:hypothetical protein
MSDNRSKHRSTARVSRPEDPSLSQSSSRFDRRRARFASKKAPTGVLKPSVTNAPGLDLPRSGSTYGVQYLKELYTVVVGLAIALPFEHLVRGQSARSPLPERPAVFLFFAFLITLVPFYHGTMRHLDTIYVEEKGPHLRSGALLAEFFLLVIQASLLFCLSATLDRPELFTRVLVVLLAVDASWIIVGHLVFFAKTKNVAEECRLLVVSHKDNLSVDRFWVASNLFTVIVLGSYLLWIGDQSSEIVLFLLIVSAVRTFADYRFNWQFYFPENNASPAKAA